jgi:D-glycero-alpha-D-manno-heptose-7-phosphate kinase
MAPGEYENGWVVIISKTPFRISLFGGGTDFREYYRRTPGRVVTLAMNRYMFVTVNKRFDSSIRASYTRTEIVEDVSQLKHDLIREALKVVGIRGGIEITTIADIPAGIGLGSSSSLTVGLLNALHAYRGEHRSAEYLAERASEIEIDILKRPIGKQDQYIAAFGGFHRFEFRPDEHVAAHPIVCSPSTRNKLIRQLMLFYTGVTRDAGSVLGEAKSRMQSNNGTLAAMDAIAAQADVFYSMVSRNRLQGTGELLNSGWNLKKQMGSKVTNPTLDTLYERARRAGAEGGKIAGAGGGGCLLLYVPLRHRKRLRDAMIRSGLKEIPFDLEPQGSRIIYVGM